MNQEDRKSTRLNSSHTDIYTLSLHDALPISSTSKLIVGVVQCRRGCRCLDRVYRRRDHYLVDEPGRSEEHTPELQSHRYLHSFPTRRSSDLINFEVNCWSGAMSSRM